MIFLNFNAAMCKFPPRSGLPHVASGLLSTKLSLGTRWIKMLTMQIDTEFSCSAVQGFLYNMHIIFIFFVLMSEGFGLKTSLAPELFKAILLEYIKALVCRCLVPQSHTFFLDKFNLILITLVASILLQSPTV